MQFTTSLVRLSYVNVFQPKADKSGNEKYSVTCLLSKSDVAGYQMLMQAIDEVKNSEMQGKLKGLNPDYVKHPVHDGDGVTAQGKPFGDECKGHWVFTASANTNRPPSIVDQRVQPIINQNDVYSGMYGHVAISIYAYNNQSQGIGFSLNGLQKVKDGEPLGNTFNVNDAFSVVAEPQQTNQQNGNWTTNSIYPDVDPLTGLPF